MEDHDSSSKMDCSSASGASLSKFPRTNDSEKDARQWSDVPSELLGSIADRLGIIELLSFRGVCKEWNVASSTASAEIESLPSCEPWFLLYGESSQCLLISESGKEYTINIPELDGATCIASNKGWLLLLQEGSMYFFCPFSLEKIDLPKLPNLKFSNCVAAFSSPPTSQDCVVSLACQNDGLDTELYVLYRGATGWTKHEKNVSRAIIKIIRCAAYHEGEEAFYFFDNMNGLVTFSVKEERLTLYEIINKANGKPPGCSSIPFSCSRNYFMKKDMKLRLRLGEDASISTCGTSFGQTKDDKLVFNEWIKATEEVESRSLKGVWIHPRFFRLPPNQSW